MNKTIQDLMERRSRRKYKTQQIKDEELDVILEAGTYAPNGGEAQSAIMISVQDKETIAMLSKKNAEILGKPDTDPFYGAPTVVIVLADKSCRPTTYVQDGSVVLGNLMIAAQALGLGSCWINRARETFASEEGKTLLRKWGIEGDFVGIGYCILGYPDGDVPEAKPRKEGYITIIK